MKAPVDAQLKLLDLQATDTAIAQVQHRRKSLPEHAALAEAQQRRGRLTEQITAIGTQVSDLELDQAKAEADLVPVRQRLIRNETRRDDGSVTDPKQLQSMIEEIGHLKKRISDLEDAELEVMGAAETAQAQYNELVAGRTMVETEMRALLATRDAATKLLDAELRGLDATRIRLVGILPRDLVDLYDRLRGRLGTGAAALRARRCGGCQIEADTAALMAYAAAAPDDVLRCEECDRILVRTLESGI